MIYIHAVNQKNKPDSSTTYESKTKKEKNNLIKIISVFEKRGEKDDRLKNLFFFRKVCKNRRRSNYGRTFSRKINVIINSN